MKRYGNLWDKICSEENIDYAFKRAFKSLKNQKIINDLQDNLERYKKEIHEMLINRTYKYGEMQRMIIHDPKERELNFPLHYYPDCILNYCLMNVVEPYFYEKYTEDTYSSIKGRGIPKALEKLKKAVNKNPHYSYLHIDCKHYYASIDHNKIKQCIRTVIKCKYTLEMLDANIDAFDKGLAIGVYSSQAYGNLLLSKIDHYVKEELRIKYYYRYMDDMFLLLPDKQTANEVFRKIEDRLCNLALTIKKNTRNAPIVNGIDFLGYKVMLYHTDISRRIKLNMQRKDRMLRKKNVEDWYYKQQMAAYFGWCIHADGINLMKSIFADKYYLFEPNIQKFKNKKKMEINKFWDTSDLYWDMSPSQKVQIPTIVGKQIIIFKYKLLTTKYGERIVIQFAYRKREIVNAEDYTEEEKRYTLTGSKGVKPRVIAQKDHLPFDCKVINAKSNNGDYIKIIPIPEEER